MTAPSHPLAETLERLAAVEPWFGAHIGAPEGDGWFRIGEVATGDRVARWVDELADRHDGHRDVAGSFLGGWLAGAATIASVASLVLERRLPDPEGELRFHRHDDGWPDAVAFESARFYVTPTDPAVGHPDAVVVERAALPAALGRALVVRLGPIFDAVRASAPFGRSGLWGSVADQLASTALWAARAGAADSEDAWLVASATTDAVAEAVPWLRARPRRFPVTTDDGAATFAVRGTCCLSHKTQPPSRGPCGEGYCTTCPFREDDTRSARFLAGC